MTDATQIIATPTQKLSAAGVSIWLDDLSRDLIRSGDLQHLIATRDVVGVTTNPTIFAAALSNGPAYNAQIHALARAGSGAAEAVFDITTTDVRAAADILAPVYARTRGQDGQVSIECAPENAHLAVETIQEAKALWARIDRPNVMIKIPATRQGLKAITAVIGSGISVNATLIFSLARYREVVEAYLDGLEIARDAGLDLSSIHSVASFFVSRVDSEINSRLETIGTAEALTLKNKAGIANARLAYSVYLEQLGAARAKGLLAAGANVQRLLWASTGVKDPALPDDMYVVELAGNGVVTTVPRTTLEAVYENSVPGGDTISGSYSDAVAVFERLSALGVSYAEVTELLQREGVKKFAASWDELLVTVHKALKSFESTVKIRVSGEPAWAVHAVVPKLIEDNVASRLKAQDPTLWGTGVETDASGRLGWIDAIALSRPLVPHILALREELRAAGVEHIVLCGMGGSSLAPETITRSSGVDLTILDTTDPDQVRVALDGQLERTAVVVSSKSGRTVETENLKRAFEHAFKQAGIDPAKRMIIVTDPGSPLDRAGREAGYRVFHADPAVGGRYAALTAFGLVPSGLAGADIARLLDEAAAVSPILGQDDPENPALILGAAIAGTAPLRDKLGLIEDGTGAVGLADWAEQLVSESTGKTGTGLLPVAMETDAPELDPEQHMYLPDLQMVRLVKDADTYTDYRFHDIVMSGPLGAQMLVWEYATAIAGRLLGINPFDQPDVELAKDAARALLTSRPGHAGPAAVVDGIQVRGTASPDAATLKEVLDGLLSGLGDHGYVAVHVYLNRHAHPGFENLREALALRARRPVTFGWGPRFLHSTGQYHKGGTQNGVFLQITADPAADLAIPHRPYTFGQLIAAQAAGDAQVLTDLGRPVLTLNLGSPDADLPALLAALR